MGRAYRILLIKLKFEDDENDGEKEPCPICKKGIMIPVGDYKITHCFYCSNCKEKLNIN